MPKGANTIEKLPNHVAIIMDGNGRWGTRRGLSREVGHVEGALAAKRIIGHALDLGIKYLTLYAFSLENWQRPRGEVDALMDLLKIYLKNNLKDLIKNNIKLEIIGDFSRLPKSLLTQMEEATNKTKNGHKMVLTLAISYSSWFDVVSMVKNIALAVKNGLESKNIDEKLLRGFLLSKNIPDPDLLIRSGGENRLSNFLLLELSYSELYFSKKLWPDFALADFDLALKDFEKRERRFGAF